jgi:hypothetical protein
MRPVIVVWHGEHRTLFYVVDASAPEGEQPCVLRTYTNRPDAEGYVRRYWQRRKRALLSAATVRP